MTVIERRGKRLYSTLASLIVLETAVELTMLMEIGGLELAADLLRRMLAPFVFLALVTGFYFVAGLSILMSPRMCAFFRFQREGPKFLFEADGPEAFSKWIERRPWDDRW